MARSMTVDKRENEKKDSLNEQKSKKRKKKRNYPARQAVLRI